MDASAPSIRSSRGPTWEPSSASLSVSTEATIRPVSASVARCSILQARRRLVPCFSMSHSPGPQRRRPVLSTSRCTGALPAFGRGTANVSARRLRVEWSGTGRLRSSSCRTEPISPSVWRSAKRNTARRVSAVVIARSEWGGCPPRLVRGAAAQAATASGVNQTVRLPRGRRAASDSAQLVPRCRCFGMWRRQAVLALNGTAGVQASEKGPSSYTAQLPTPTGRSMQQGAILLQFFGPAATGSGGVWYVARMRCDWTAEFPAFAVPNGQHTDIAEHRGEPPLDHTGSGMAFLAPGGDKRKLSRNDRVVDRHHLGEGEGRAEDLHPSVERLSPPLPGFLDADAVLQRTEHRLDGPAQRVGVNDFPRGHSDLGGDEQTWRLWQAVFILQPDPDGADRPGRRGLS